MPAARNTAHRPSTCRPALRLDIVLRVAYEAPQQCRGVVLRTGRSRVQEETMKPTKKTKAGKGKLKAKPLRKVKTLRASSGLYK